MLCRSASHKALSLPPLFTARQAAQPWQAALADVAACPSPGLLIYAPISGLLEAAVVLTPDRPVDDETVLRLATLAVMDSVAALVPPKAMLAIVSTGVITLNQGEVAATRLARGPALADGVPAWFVLGFTVRLDLRLSAPGLTPWLSDLVEEGVEVSGPELLESMCRHLLAAIDLWQHEGEAGIDRAWRAAHATGAA